MCLLACVSFCLSIDWLKVVWWNLVFFSQVVGYPLQEVDKRLILFWGPFVLQEVCDLVSCILQIELVIQYLSICRMWVIPHVKWANKLIAFLYLVYVSVGVLHLFVTSVIHANVISDMSGGLCHVNLLIRYINTDWVLGTFCWSDGMLIMQLKSHYILVQIMPFGLLESVLFCCWVVNHQLIFWTFLSIRK